MSRCQEGWTLSMEVVALGSWVWFLKLFIVVEGMFLGTISRLSLILGFCRMFIVLNFFFHMHLTKFFCFFFVFGFTLGRIIPRTLMCKEVHNLSIFQMGFLLPFLFVEISFLFRSTGSKLSPFCLQVCMVPLKMYACVVLSLTDNR